MNNIAVDKEVVNISKLVKGSSKDKILEKLQYSFEVVNKFINTQNSEAPNKVVWIKKDEKDSELLKVGFWKNSEAVKAPKVRIDFKASYFQEEKIRIIKCVMENALKEWKSGDNKLPNKKNKLLLPVNGKEYSILFE